MDEAVGSFLEMLLVGVGYGRCDTFTSSYMFGWSAMFYDRSTRLYDRSTSLYDRSTSFMIGLPGYMIASASLYDRLQMN